MASGMSCSGRHTKWNAAEEECIDRTALAGPVGMSQTQTSGLELEGQLQQLLPGIPDDITRYHIIPKLPWTDFHILLSLSRSWNQSAQSSEGYNARVRSHSTETLIVVSNHTVLMNFIALYSMRSKTFFNLPSIAGVDGGIPFACQCVSIHSRVYILGGLEKKTRSSPIRAIDSVYVLDLVGRRKWRRCANIPRPRVEFGCGVLDGKIYVLGGKTNELPVPESLVYDPKVNAWSEIAATSSLRWAPDVAVVGGELVLYSGVTCDWDEDWDEPELEEDDYIVGNYTLAEALVLRFYNPVRNEWRKVETELRLTDVTDELVFLANGYVYVLNGRAIYRYDMEKNIWTNVHEFSCAALGPIVLRFHHGPKSVLAVNGELLATFYWFRGDNGTHGTILLQSRGFGGEKKIIVWEKVNCPVNFGEFPTLHRTIQL